MYLPTNLSDPFRDRLAQWETRSQWGGRGEKITLVFAHSSAERRL
jgi:hypothetical protein